MRRTNMQEHIQGDTSAVINDDLGTETTYIRFTTEEQIDYKIIDEAPDGSFKVIMDSVQSDPDPSGHVSITLPNRLPLPVVFAGASSFATIMFGILVIYFTQQSINDRLLSQLDDMSKGQAEIQSEIYTKKEAALQFAGLKDENSRQDESIRDLREELRQVKYKQ
jgi:hypothetical protein